MDMKDVYNELSNTDESQARDSQFKESMFRGLMIFKWNPWAKLIVTVISNFLQ